MYAKTTGWDSKKNMPQEEKEYSDDGERKMWWEEYLIAHDQVVHHH